MKYRDEDVNVFMTLAGFKSCLINQSAEELVRLYTDVEHYKSLELSEMGMNINTIIDLYKRFLSLVVMLLEYEDVFLLLDEAFIDKIRTVIHSIRFDIKDKNCIEVINGIIMELNILQNLSENVKNSRLNNYVVYQEDCRKLDFERTEELLVALSYDAIVFESLVLDDKSDELDDIFFVCSTNYFISNFPELYQDAKFLESTMKKLNDISNIRGFQQRMLREYARDTNQFFKTITK